MHEHYACIVNTNMNRMMRKLIHIHDVIRSPRFPIFHRYGVRHRHSFQRSYMSASRLGPPPTLKELPNDQKQQIEVYMDTLMDWNTRMNLTGLLVQSCFGFFFSDKA